MSVQIPQTSPDSSSAVADSLGSSLTQIGEGVSDTGRLILRGDWDAILERFVGGATEVMASSIPRFISAIFVGLVFYALYRALRRLVQGLLARSRSVDPGLEALLMKVLRVMGLSFIGLMVLAQLGINVSALIAGLGIAGLAVGFAAKDSLENFISGVTILLDRPFRVGDWITVGDHYGQVINITLRSTRLRTLNGEKVVFPSVDMVTQPIVNHSTDRPLRLDIPFGIAYKERIADARDTVMALVDPEDPRLAPGQEHRVVTTGLGDSSVDMALHLYLSDPGKAVPLRFEFTERIRNALGEADIEIPFPHMQLFIDGADGFRDVGIVARGEPGKS